MSGMRRSEWRTKAKLEVFRSVGMALGSTAEVLMADYDDYRRVESKSKLDRGEDEWW